MAEFLRRLARGLATASQDWPQLAARHEQMQQQQAGLERQDQEAKRGRIMSMLNIAMASDNPEATKIAFDGMMKSGLFPEMNALFSSSEASPAQAPRAPIAPSGPMPGVDLPANAHAPGMASAMTPGDIESTPTPGGPGETAISRFAPKAAQGAAAMTPMPSMPALPTLPAAKAGGSSFIDAISSGIATKKARKDQEFQFKVGADQRAEERAQLQFEAEQRQRDTQERLAQKQDIELFGEHVIGDRVFRRDPKTGAEILVRTLNNTHLDQRQSAALSMIMDRALNKASKEIPSRSISRILGEARLQGIPIDPADEGYIKDTFNQYAMDVQDFISTTDNTKLGSLDLVQNYAKKNLQFFHGLRPEQLVALGPLQGKYNAVREKYAEDHSDDLDRDSRAQQAAFTAVANDPQVNDQGMRDLLLGLASEYEVFARMQTGAAISPSETDSFNNLIGAATLEAPALQARLVGMINFGNMSRSAVYTRALQTRYAGNWEEGKAQAAKVDQFNIPPEDYLPFIGDQALAEMANHPQATTLYPGARAELKRRLAEGGE